MDPDSRAVPGGLGAARATFTESENSDIVAERSRYSGQGSANEPTFFYQNCILASMGFRDGVGGPLVHLLLSLRSRGTSLESF